MVIFLRQNFFIFAFLISVFGASSQSPMLVVPVNDTKDVQSIDLSPDGSLIATGHSNNRVVIWDARTGRELRYLFTGGAVLFVKFTPDGQYLISGSRPMFGNFFTGSIVFKWEVKTGKLMETLPFTSTKDIQISTDGRQYLSHNILPFSQMTVTPQHSELLNYFMGNSKFSIWDTTLQKVVSEYFEKNEGNSFFTNFNGKSALAMTRKSGLLGTGKSEIIFIGTDLLRNVYTPTKESKNSKLLGGIIDDLGGEKLKGKLGKLLSVAQAVDNRNKAILGTIKLKYKTDKIFDCQNAGFIGSEESKNNIELYDVNTGAIKCKLKVTGTVEKLVVQEKLSRVIIVSKQSGQISITIADLSSGKNITESKISAEGGSFINISNDANFITVKYDEGVCTYNFFGRKMLTLVDHSTPVNTLGVSTDSRYVYTSPLDGKAKIVKDSIKLDSFLWYIHAIEYQEKTKSYESVYSDQGKDYIDKRKRESYDTIKKYARKFVERRHWDNIGPYHWDIQHAKVYFKDKIKYPFIEDSISPNKKFNLTHDFYYNENASMAVEMFSNMNYDFGEENKADPNASILLRRFYGKGGYFMKFMSEEALFLPYKTLIYQNNKTARRIKLIPLDTADYVLLLDNGYFMGSKSSKRRIYYVVGNQTISFDQLDTRYNRPDLVLAALGGDNNTIQAYKNAYLKRIKKLQIDTTQFSKGLNVPEAEILNKNEIVYEQESRQIALNVSAKSNTSELVGYNIWVNDVPIFGKNGLSVKDKHQKNISSIEIPVTLSEGINNIEVSFTNKEGLSSLRSPLAVYFKPKEPLRPKTYFIGIGTEMFADAQYNLKYSVKDIRDFCAALKSKLGDQLIVDTLFNKNFTIANLLQIRKKLSAAGVDDKVIVSYSGHGLLSSSFDYFLSTFNTNFSKPELTSISYDELESLLDGVPPRRKLLLIDACHSGEVDKEDLRLIDSVAASNQLSRGIKPGIAKKSGAQLGMKNSFELMQELFVNVDKNTGATIIAAAAGTQFALERGDLKNGVFTFCILDFLSNNTHPTIEQIKQYVNFKVPEITRGLQQPTTRNENLSNDWQLW